MSENVGHICNIQAIDVFHLLKNMFELVFSKFKKYLSFSDPRHCHALHPEECAQVHGCPRLAVVEAAHQDQPDAQRPQNRGPAKVENGES